MHRTRDMARTVTVRYGRSPRRSHTSQHAFNAYGNTESSHPRVVSPSVVAGPPRHLTGPTGAAGSRREGGPPRAGGARTDTPRRQIQLWFGQPYRECDSMAPAHILAPEGLTPVARAVSW
jgi:hypothetical protein